MINNTTAIALAALAFMVFKTRGAAAASFSGEPLTGIMVWSSLDSTRAANVGIIQAEFARAGYNGIAAAAAVVNAIAESGLNAGAIGDGGSSVGLFQLHENGGGSGMSVADRTDPTKNAIRILEETKQGKGAAFLADYKGGAGFLQLVYSFCVNVERPAESHTRGLERQAMARKIFPSLVTSA
jgi:hypothetical protein